MKITADIGGRKYKVDLGRPLDISIPVSFGKKQLSAFGGAPATKRTYKTGTFIGDVRRGGSCNCEVYTFSPHLNGTHTECVGHITKERVAVGAAARESFIPATLVTVKGGLITGKMLEKLLKGKKAFLDALIVRTQPNGRGKITKSYKTAPCFSADAMRLIVRAGVRHLLVDFPSVDRLDDERLTNHRLFWAKNPMKKTITELVYAPDKIKDGRYLLNLQVASFEADAAPSRPVLYGVSA